MSFDKQNDILTEEVEVDFDNLPEPEAFEDDLDDEDFEPDEPGELGWDPYAGDYVDDEPMDYWDAPYDE